MGYTLCIYTSVPIVARALIVLWRRVFACGGIVPANGPTSSETSLAENVVAVFVLRRLAWLLAATAVSGDSKRIATKPLADRAMPYRFS